MVTDEWLVICAHFNTLILSNFSLSRYEELVFLTFGNSPAIIFCALSHFSAMQEYVT